jgi:hypothetical protein
MQYLRDREGWSQRAGAVTSAWADQNRQLTRHHGSSRVRSSMQQCTTLGKKDGGRDGMVLSRSLAGMYKWSHRPGTISGRVHADGNIIVHPLPTETKSPCYPPCILTLEKMVFFTSGHEDQWPVFLQAFWLACAHMAGEHQPVCRAVSTFRRMSDHDEPKESAIREWKWNGICLSCSRHRSVPCQFDSISIRVMPAIWSVAGRSTSQHHF